MMDDFDRDFKKAEKRFNFLWNFNIAFFFVVLALMIAGLIGTVYFASKSASAIEKDGLKSVLVRIWEGEKK